MHRLLSGLLVLGLLGGAVHAETDSPLLNITALMPPHPTHENDSYICTVVKAPEEAMHLVGFTPEAHQSTVHHMLLFGEWSAPSRVRPMQVAPAEVQAPGAPCRLPRKSKIRSPGHSPSFPRL